MFNQLPLDQIFVLLASLGLSLSAGVRAYLPVLAVAIASHLDKVGGFQITLRPEFIWVGDPLFIGLLVILTIYEISADKIPVIDHLNDTVHTVIRPLSGALIFVSTNNLLTDHGTALVIVAGLLGASIAGTTHVAKAAVVRPATTVTTMGLANPIVSLAEDALVIFTTLLSLFAPILGALLFVILAFVAIRAIMGLRSRRRAKAAAIATGTR